MEILHRLTSPKPKLWANVQKFFGVLVLVGIAMMLLHSDVPMTHTTLAKLFILTGLAGAVFCQLTKEDVPGEVKHVTLQERLSFATTPKFWQNVQKVCLGLCAAGIYFQTNSIEVEFKGFSLVKALLIFGGLGATIGQFTHTDPAPAA